MGVRRNYNKLELEKAYAAGGIEAVAKKFGITQAHARCILIRREIHIPREYVRQPSTPFLDATIRKAYESGDSTQVKLVAEKHKVKLGWVKWRALQLGCRAQKLKKEPAWSDAEIEIVREMEGYTTSTIQRKLKAAGFIRTMSAIHNKLRILELLGSREEGYTATDVARLLGHTNSHAVQSWIDKGWLKGERARFSTLPHDDPKKPPVKWLIRPSVLRQFCIENASLIDFRKLAPNAVWFISLLTDSDLSRPDGAKRPGRPPKQKEEVLA